MAALTKQERLALRAEDFAVPARRILPLHDAKHVQMAAKTLDAVSGLTDPDRRAARKRILERAESFGLDTTRWSKLSAASVSIEAMALNISNGGDHPNKMPFSGILTRIGEPSDFPPGGSDGKLVIVTLEAAEKALESLLGMAVDYTPSFDGHDAQAKIGLITSAEIEGNALVIEGFVYAADFPEQAAFIRANKDILGFSFEAKEIYVRDPSADPLEIVECMFTGAAILRKDKAAYSTTSLAASAETGLPNMTKEELLAALGEAISPALAAAMAPVNDRLAAVEANAKASADAAAKHTAALEANKAVMDKVEPHATALEACAEGMMAAGIGAAEHGHGAVLRRMASSMRAEAALGRVPSHFYAMAAAPAAAAAALVSATDPKVAELEAKLAGLSASTAKATEDAIKLAVEAATKPLSEEIASLKTKAKDIEAGTRRTAPEAERKTLSPQISALLSRAGLQAGADGDAKLTAADIDAAFAKAGITDVTQRITVKKALEAAGRF